VALAINPVILEIISTSLDNHLIQTKNALLRENAYYQWSCAQESELAYNTGID